MERLASLWRNNSTDVLRLTLPKECTAFHEKYDAIQGKFKQISVLDELLAGMNYVVACTCRTNQNALLGVI